MRRSALMLAAALTLAGSLAATLPAAAAPTAQPAVRYLVTTSGEGRTAAALGRVRSSSVGTVYRTVLPGFTATLTPAEAARLRSQPGVTSVVPDGVVHATTLQDDPTWGLDRIDQRARTASRSYRYDTTGKGVTAFVIDTGILLTHSQFGGRATSGTDLVDGDADATDCEGHGTHVAGTIGGRTYGAAKDVSLVAVRALDCTGSGYVSDIITALDWVVAHKPSGPSLVNLSLSGAAYPALDEAVERVVAAGVPVVVAAGNSGGDACWESPARTPEALTVGAVDRADARPSWSNYGSCVDLFAPGQDVRSAGIASTSASLVLSGTSMSAPHVAGVVARYLQKAPTATPDQVEAALRAGATTGAVTDAGEGSPDRLLYVTRPSTAPGVVRGVVSKVDRTKLAVTLTWKVPTDNGGRAVTGFLVTRSGKDAKGVSAQSVTVKKGVLRWTSPKLRKGAPYAFTVRALNPLGRSAAVTVKPAAL